MKKPPQQNLPRFIDPRKFAHQGIELHGQIDLSDLHRLQDVLFDTEGHLLISLSFLLNEQKFRVVQGEISGLVRLPCQRCLEATELSLSLPLSVAVVRSEDEAKQLPRILDPLLLPEEILDLYDFIEEEVLLGLPMVAYHKEDCATVMEFGPDGASQSKDSGDEAISDRSAAPAVAKKENPFSVLASLKLSDKDTDH